MTPKEEGNPVSRLRLSSMYPGKSTGTYVTHQLTNMDLAMKLHYINAVYFFESEAVEGLSIDDLKTPIPSLLEIYNHVCGRIRRHETSSRPYIKCSDTGIRVAEAFVEGFTLDEWMKLRDPLSDQRYLVYNQTLGPEIAFSPLVSLQFTWFKCGGISIGLSWAHVLGDSFSASNFMNMYGVLLSGHIPPIPLKVENLKVYGLPLSNKLVSIKRVDPVADYWLTTNARPMDTYSFHITSNQLDLLVSSVCDKIHFSYFEIISAIIWHSLIKLRRGSRLSAVTICTNDSNMDISTNENMVISAVKAEHDNTDIPYLAGLIANEKIAENVLIEKEVEKESGNIDLLVYGTNLTFVNLEEAKLYEFQLNGCKPVYVYYTVIGVGDEGTVLVVPGRERRGENATTVNIVLPKDELSVLQNELHQILGTLEEGGNVN